MKRTIIEFLIGIPIVAGLYTLLDFLYDTFIVHIPFVFDMKYCVLCLSVWTAYEAAVLISRVNKERW